MVNFRLRTLGWVAVSIAGVLVGCGGGFHTVDPSRNNDDIMYVVNSSPFAFAENLQVTPLPLPTIPPGSAGPSPVAPGLQPLQVVPSTPISPKGQAPKLVLPDGQPEPADTTIAPYTKIGRITFRFPTDQPGWGHLCTAQFIGNLGVVLTAAHCVWDQQGKVWGNNYAFQLGYKPSGPTQSFTWECAAIMSGWANGQYAYDYAVLKIRGVPPSGGLGMTINVGATHVDAVGYPDNFGNNEIMYHVYGSKDGSNPSGLLNPLGHGASGGAWIMGSAPENETEVVSLNSFKYTNDNSRMYGPQLSASTLRLYDFASRSCRDQVRSIGAAPLTSSNEINNSNDDTLIARLSEDVSAGAVLTSESDQTCLCGDNRMLYASNTDDDQHLIGLRYTKTKGNASGTTTGEDYILLKPKEKKPLICTRTSSDGGTACDIDNSYRLSSDRLTAGSVSMPKSIPGVATASLLAAN
jgi:V8-like Glu-specific endopeptidase